MFNFLKREPNLYIGGKEDPYMLRWWIIPKNPFFNIYLHKFLRSDDDRALHDHPWWSIGMILSGAYLEHMPDNSMHHYNIGGMIGMASRWQHERGTVTKVRKAFRPVFRSSKAIHRVELLKTCTGIEYPVWTIFITGPRVRDWGFWCPKGWVLWTKFVENKGNESKIGKGCDQ